MKRRGEVQVSDVRESGKASNSFDESDCVFSLQLSGRAPAGFAMIDLATGLDVPGGGRT